MKSNSKPRGRLVNLAALVVIIYLVVLFFSQQMEIIAMDRQEDNLRQEMERLQARRSELAEERELLDTIGYVEMVAREQLGLVKEGEILYTIAGQDED